MPIIRIPKAAKPGLAELAKLKSDEVTKLADFLYSSPVGIRMNEIVSFLNSSLNIPTNKSHEIVQTLVSFRSLLEPPNVDFESLSSNLSSSYKESSVDSFSSEDERNLKEALLIIFKKSQNLKLTLKAERLFYDDDAVFSESRIVTDIRIVFDDDLSEKKRNAILVHRLNIEYNSTNETKNFFISLNLANLKQLKDVIERALHKEELIAKDYEQNIHFIGSSLK